MAKRTSLLILTLSLILSCLCACSPAAQHDPSAAPETTAAAPETPAAAADETSAETPSADVTESAGETEAFQGNWQTGWFISTDAGPVLVAARSEGYLKERDFAFLRPYSGSEIDLSALHTGDGIRVRSFVLQDSLPPGLVPEEIETADLSDAALSFADAAELVRTRGYIIPDDPNAPAENPTGYPDGDVQRPFLYCCQTLYVYQDEQLYPGDLPANCRRIGTVAAVDNTVLPSGDFAAAHLDAGTELYADAADPPETVYAKVLWRNDELFMVFRPYTE